MDQGFIVKRAGELMDEEFTAKWREREALDPLQRVVLATILKQLVATGQPVPIHVIERQLVQQESGDLRAATADLDAKDLILVEDDHVVLAYPFSARPTPFQLVFPDSRERYAVCAIDALGIPAMLDHPVTIRSRCHHCGEPLELTVRPDGPVDGDGVMVWVGERGDLRQKACMSICQTLNFFRSKDHLAVWRASHSDVPGAAAELREAFTLGRTIFGELLRNVLRVDDGRERRRQRTA